MWDGYKDVQFGWLVVNESKSSTSKQALFLVMYIPSRELLEIWAMQNYEKVSVSKVSNHGRYFLISSVQIYYFIAFICIIDYSTPILVYLELLVLQD